jgi:hypothetical protein
MKLDGETIQMTEAELLVFDELRSCLLSVVQEPLEPLDILLWWTTQPEAIA